MSHAATPGLGYLRAATLYHDKRELPRALSLFKLGTVAVDALHLRIAGHAGDDRASTLHRPEEVAADG